MNLDQSNFPPDEFDALLRRSLQRRPQPPAPADLAARAIDKATRAFDPATLQMLQRVNRWNRITTAVAAALIIAIAAWMFRAHLAAGGFQSWSDSTETTTDVTSSTTSDSSTLAADWMWVGAAMAVGAVVVVLAQRALSSNDDWTTWPRIAPH